MKKIVGLVAGTLLLAGFANKDDDSVDGLWMGYYKKGVVKERMIVKLDANDHIEFYTGNISEQTAINGSYQLLGDSITFNYVTVNGEACVMRGQFSRRKNYVDGVWATGSSSKGMFFMEKQEVEEKTVQP